MSKESSEKLMLLAETMIKDPNVQVRSLAASVLSQFEPDAGPDYPSTFQQAHATERDPEFWRGFWAGMWACQR